MLTKKQTNVKPHMISNPELNDDFGFDLKFHFQSNLNFVMKRFSTFTIKRPKVKVTFRG